MLLMGALGALLAVGAWLYCLVDIVLTSRAGCRRLPREAWLAIVALTFTIGAAAWLFLGRPRSGSLRSPRPGVGQRRRLRSPLRARARQGDFDPRAAIARSRHPAGRGRPIGPDDDAEFLLQLDRMIKGGSDAGNEP